MSKLALPLCLAFALAPLLIAAPRSDAARADGPRELGRVDWIRDFDAGQAVARRTGRPLFVLFQEVPGCATCVGFGESVLSHPLLAEAIESAFVPVAVLNNRPGRDAEVLRRFGEPAWNNPVVRFLDSEARDLLPRADGVWSRHGIATRMLRALQAAGRPVPAYLALLAEESVPRAERAVFEMHCFWSGEACLGGLPGVVGTRAGWLGGREVVEVRFDPKRTSRERLWRAARRGGCARSVFVPDAGQERAAAAVLGADAVRRAPGAMRSARASDQQRHLRASPLAALDLTPLQRTRVNAALASGDDPARWLSPRQRAALSGETPTAAAGISSHR